MAEPDSWSYDGNDGSISDWDTEDLTSCDDEKSVLNDDSSDVKNCVEISPIWRKSMKSNQQTYQYLLNKEIFCDIQFEVSTNNSKEQRFSGHKLILAAFSPVFAKMFYGENATSEKEIRISDTMPEVFNTMLKFLYTEELDDTRLNHVISVMDLAYKYQLHLLSNVCIKFLKEKLDEENAVKIFEKSNSLSLTKLADLSLEIINLKTENALQSQHFLDIKFETFVSILNSDLLHINEVKLFQHVLRWAKAECKRQDKEETANNFREVLGEGLKLVRFPLMTMKEFAEVALDGLLTNKELADIASLINNEENFEKSSFNCTPRRAFDYIELAVGEESKLLFKSTKLDFKLNEDVLLMALFLSTSCKPDLLNYIAMESSNNSSVEKKLNFRPMHNCKWHASKSEEGTKIEFEDGIILKNTHMYRIRIQLKKNNQQLKAKTLESSKITNHSGSTCLEALNKRDEKSFITGVLLSSIR